MFPLAAFFYFILATSFRNGYFNEKISTMTKQFPMFVIQAMPLKGMFTDFSMGSTAVYFSTTGFILAPRSVFYLKPSRCEFVIAGMR